MNDHAKVCAKSVRGEREMNYVPELGQVFFGAPHGEYGVPSYAESLIAGVLSKLGMVYWNLHQEEWNQSLDPQVEGLTIRPYWWGDEDAPEASLPNLECEGLELRWYKYPLRGLSANVEWDHTQWCEWHDKACNKILRDFEKKGGNN